MTEASTSPGTPKMIQTIIKFSQQNIALDARNYQMSPCKWMRTHSALTILPSNCTVDHRKEAPIQLTVFKAMCLILHQPELDCMKSPIPMLTEIAVQLLPRNGFLLMCVPDWTE